MAEEIIKLQNPEKYYTALEKLRTDKIYLLIPDNKELILQFLKDAEIGRTILKGQKRKIKPGRLQRMLWLLVVMERVGNEVTRVDEWLGEPCVVDEDLMKKFFLEIIKFKYASIFYPAWIKKKR
ncbi:hypothetical protein COU59_03705 [Candidatus Pacearchaeota archaeon CG10_big_fil_rev_8_21_14_0_10_34_12]|nr:MAG: hypothetical protein COU59_03705 [Candidatus Pacearchaeota archaeon CG10_big_fil_rev_8_21_14_0_10_34_12]